MSRPPRIVRRNLKGQTPSGYIWGRLDAGDGPSQLLPLADVRDALLGPGGMARYIGSRVAASNVAGSGYNPFAVKVPELADWTTFGTAGLTTDEGLVDPDGKTSAIRLTGPYAAANDRLMGIYRPAPATPYKIAAFIETPPILDAFNSTGIGFYDVGTGKLATINVMGRQAGTAVMLNKFNYNSVSSYNSGSNLMDLSIRYAWGFWFYIGNDGTNIEYGVMPDGVTPTPLFTETVAGGFLGPSGWGYPCFYISPSSNPVPITTLYDWYSTMLLWDENAENRTLSSVYG